MHDSSPREKIDWYASKHFFSQKKYKGDYTASLPYMEVHASLQRIRVEVPSWLHLKACESLYYHIQDTRDRAFEMEYLNALDAFLPVDSMRAFTDMVRATLYMENGQFEQAQICLLNSINLSIREERYARAADGFRNLGKCKTLEGNYDKAIKYLLSAEDYFNKIADKDEQIVRFYEIQILLAKSYAFQKDYSKAHTYFLKAYNWMATVNNSESSTLVAADYIGHNYMDRGLPVEAEQWLDSAHIWKNRLLMRQNKPVEYGMSRHWHLAGRIALAKNMPQSALHFFQKAVSVVDPERKEVAVLNYYKYLGDAFIKMKRLDSAAFYYGKAAQTFDLNTKLEVFKSLDALYLSVHNYQAAASIKDSIYHIEKQLFTAEKEREITALQALRDLAEKEKALSHADADKKILLLILLLIGGAFAWVIFVAQMKLRQQHNKKLRRIRELSIITAKANLQYIALEQVSFDIEQREKELLEKEKGLNLKNRLIAELEARLSALSERASQQGETAVLTEKQRILTTEDWQQFRKDFDKAFPGFVFGLKRALPKITPSEIRLFLLIKIGLDSPKIAQTLGISAESVYKSRYRLRQKLNLPEADNLDDFIRNFKA